MIKTWLRKLLYKVIAFPIRRRWQIIEEATQQPQLVQEALLERILKRQVDTDFGREHHFAAIRTVADFRRQLPIASYEFYEPYIARMRRGQLQALLADTRIHMFALTSGTTAARKYIPVNDQYIADYRRGWTMWGSRAYKDHPNIRLRSILQISSDWQEFTTEAGIPCGAVTGLTANAQLRIVRRMYSVPPCVGKVKDPLAKHYLALRLSIPRQVAMIIAANPSTIVNMARTGDQEKETLLRDLHDGTLSQRFDIPADIRAQLQPVLSRRHPQVVRLLEEIIRRSGTLYPKDYWPPYCLICNWTGGSVGAYLRHLPRYYGDMPIRDVGLIASEGRFSIPLADRTPSGLLDVTSHYFEFVPEEEIDSPQPTVLGAHELQQERNYFILPTTSYGLYRYHICDLVKVRGFYNRTPMIEFLSKGANFANITGEKLSEYQVVAAMAAVLGELDLTLTAYSLAPCWDEEQPYYGLFVERSDLADRAKGLHVATLLEHRLGEANVEYAAKRQSRRLGPIRLELLPAGTWQQWDRQRLSRSGGTIEQYKHPCLINDLHFRDTIEVEEELATA